MMTPKTLDKISVQMRNSFSKMLTASETMDKVSAIAMFREIVKKDLEFVDARKRLRELEIENADNVDSTKAMISSITFPMIIAIKKIFAKKNVKSMLESCEDALSVNIKNISVLSKMADIATAGEAYFIAVEALELALKFKPNNKAFLNKLAEAYIKNKQAGKAVELYTDYLRNNPKDSKIKAELKRAKIEASIQLNNADEEGLDDENDPQKIAEKKARELENTILQQILEGTIRDQEQARLVIKKLKPVAEKTNSIDALRKLAEAYKVAEDYDNAIASLEVVASSLGTLDAKLDKDIEKLYLLKYNQQLNIIRSRANEYENAEELIDKIENDIVDYKIEKAKIRSAHFINDIHLHYDLALEYFNAGYLNEAYREFEISQKNAKHRGNSLYYMARILLVDGEVDKAMPLLKKAHDNLGIKERNYKPATYYLGLLFENDGDKEKAQAMYESVYQLDPNYKDIKEKVKK